MFKKTIVLTAVLLSGIIFAQEKTSSKPEVSVKGEKPLQIRSSQLFTVKDLSFNKKVDLQGKGELLQVEFAIENDSDSPHDLYIYVLAYVNENDWEYNTLQTRKLSLRGIKNKYFSPSPNDKKQFEYGDGDAAVLKKYPKDPKAGLNPLTGKPYRLDNYLPVRTDHLCAYRKKYEYFNYVTIFIFDEDGELQFYENYSLNKKGRR